MIEVAIQDAPQRMPKRLRHAFDVQATVRWVPLHMLQRGLGQLETNARFENFADLVSRLETPASTRSGVTIDPRAGSLRWNVLFGPSVQG